MHIVEVTVKPEREGLAALRRWRIQDSQRSLVPLASGRATESRHDEIRVSPTSGSMSLFAFRVFDGVPLANVNGNA